MGAIQFSPDLNYWHHQRELWQLVLCHCLGYQVHTPTIWKLAHQLHITNPLAFTLSMAHSNFREAST